MDRYSMSISAYMYMVRTQYTGGLFTIHNRKHDDCSVDHTVLKSLNCPHSKECKAVVWHNIILIKPFSIFFLLSIL